MNDQSPDLDLSTSADATRGPISRRTVLAGTAFAVPAIVLTAGTPALAASGVLLLFDKSIYNGAGCSTISGVKVSASDSGTPKAGLAVTVSLSNSYTFSGGGNSFTGVTGSAGSLSLPAINVPASGGTGTATGTASGAGQATATLQGTSVPTGFYLVNNVQKTAVGVPAGSTPLYGYGFLAPDGRFIDGSGGGIVGTNVDKMGQWVRDNGSFSAVPVIKKDGSAVYYESNIEKAAVGVPAGSTPLYGFGFLAPDGRFIDGSSGGIVGTNIDKMGQWVDNAAGTFGAVPAVKRDGSAVIYENNAERAAVGVPSGSTPLYGFGFLAPDGRFIDGSNGGTVGSNIDKMGQWVRNKNDWSAVPAVKKDGSAVYFESNVERAAVGVPSGSSPVYGFGFLTSDGRFLDGSNGVALSTNVDKIGWWVGSPDDTFGAVPLTKKETC